MAVCLKCGWEIVIGPAGCACTQAARRKREMEEAAKASEELVKKLGPILDEARRVQAMPPEEREQLEIQEARKKLDVRRQGLQHEQEVLQVDFRALQRRCKHPKLRQYSVMGELGNVCDDCGYQD